MLWWSLTIAIGIFWIALLVTYKQKLVNEKLCELSFIEFFLEVAFPVFEAGHVVVHPIMGVALEV
jgi:hypothetical protein